MKCQNCSAENSPTAKFCENCGQPLPRRCPNCGQPVTAVAKFCSSCGFNLAAAGATPPQPATHLTDLRQAAPAALQDKIFSARTAMEGERKLVTALFTDIVGSTELAEAMDPEDWREVVTGAHQRVSHAVYRYEGTIAQLLGDGVLAFFGAPLTHEDDAERAVRASLDILAAIQAYAEELRRKNSVRDFRMRVGLNTGTVVVGNIGDDLHMEYLAVGDTVNLAARMQSAADPDNILITENTHRLIRSLFELQDGGRISVKGKGEPVQVYRVLGERKGAVQMRGIAGLSSPLVGRERELATLQRVSADLRAGRGGIVSVIGEAGLGKSRLIAEWRKTVVPAPQRSAFAGAGSTSPGERGVPAPAPSINWVEGRCLSYGSTLAYHLSTDILRAFIGVPADAPEGETRRRLREVLTEKLGEESAEVYPILGHLLGLKLEDEDESRVRYLDGPALQSRYVGAYRRLLEALALERPTVIVADDVHWADPSSVELGLQLLPLAAQLPLALVFLTRSDRDSAGWRLLAEAREVPGASAIELHLSPLADENSEALVKNLLEDSELPENLRPLILAKAEGNPFYVEEVIRMLIDQSGLVRRDGRWVSTRDIRDIEIPDTLQGVIMARIDRLPEEAKRVLQVASVIGRRFQVRILEMVLAQHDAP